MRELWPTAWLTASMTQPAGQATRTTTTEAAGSAAVFGSAEAASLRLVSGVGVPCREAIRPERADAPGDVVGWGLW